MIPVRRLPAPLSEVDAVALSALHARAFDGSDGRWGRGWSAAEIAVLAESQGVILLAAGSVDAPLGFALFRVAADEAELLTIATLPEARRTGAAKAILAAASPMLREKGAATVFLEVGAGNAAAIALYRSAGYFRVGVRAGYYVFSDGGRDDALIFKLVLT